MRAADRPRRSRRIEVHRVEDGCVVYVPATDDVHFLNGTAMEVLDRCDGTRTIAALQAEYGAPGEVGFDLSAGILAQFERAGLIVSEDAAEGDAE
jgi:hypothetical protein